MKKIYLEEGSVSSIKHNDLNLSTLLQVYDEKSAGHLIGDIYLRVDNKGESIAEFYIAHDQSTKEYYTKIYKNYLLTFMIQDNNQYLIIEQAEFGKVFALLNNSRSTIGSKDDLVEIEITDFTHEWGYHAPPGVENRAYFSDVHYTLQINVRDVIKSFSFSSSNVGDGFAIDIGDYSLLILSDLYKNSSCLIEMRINKKENDE
jgi:hypothetical protein